MSQGKYQSLNYVLWLIVIFEIQGHMTVPKNNFACTLLITNLENFQLQISMAFNITLKTLCISVFQTPGNNMIVQTMSQAVGNLATHQNIQTEACDGLDLLRLEGQIWLPTLQLSHSRPLLYRGKHQPGWERGKILQSVYISCEVENKYIDIVHNIAITYI